MAPGEDDGQESVSSFDDFDIITGLGRGVDLLRTGLTSHTGGVNKYREEPVRDVLVWVVFHRREIIETGESSPWIPLRQKDAHLACPDPVHALPLRVLRAEQPARRHDGGHT